VAQTTDRTVAVFDLESGRVEKSIAVPGTPGDLALPWLGRLLAVVEAK
jgi:hypothetical protein